MGILQDALFNAGAASEKQLRETTAEIELRSEMEAARRAKPAKEREKRLGILRTTTSPDTFRSEARKLLLLYPALDMVHELLSLAHGQGMRDKKAKGGMRLIANLYQVKEALQQSGLSDEDKHTLVDKLFPKK